MGIVGPTKNKTTGAMSSLRLAILALLGVFAVMGPASAELTALARIDADRSGLADTREGVEVTLSLSQPVPWRVFTLDAPRRLVVDLSEAAWPAAIPDRSDRAGPVQTGLFRAGWSRLVVDLTGPLSVDRAVLETGAADGSAVLRIGLVPVPEEEFAARAGAPASARTLPSRSRRAASGHRAETDSLRVMLDPGHGGRDPGAEAGGLREADLMLAFARELREVLIRSGGFDVALTREDDRFVPLESRITLARAYRADVLLSLHADALPEDAGHASGATVYTLSEEASDRASRLLAERHDQSDLLAGIDLDGQGDEIALVLMDLARRDTAPRAMRLATVLVDRIRAKTGHVSGRPLRHAGFSVLKAPDIPSVLLELGFLSSEEDRARLGDADWRSGAAEAIRSALRDWAAAEVLGPDLAGAE